MVEQLGLFEILETKLWDEVMTTQSGKNYIWVKLKGLQKNIASVTTDLTGVKAVNEKLERCNELLGEAIKHQTKLDENLLRENSELLRVKKYL